jgi:hypothetical protein
LWDDKNICVSIDKMTHPYALFNFDISIWVVSKIKGRN